MTTHTLSLSYANCLDDRIGEPHGIPVREFEAAGPKMQDLTHRLAEMRAQGRTRWRDLPFDPLRAEHLEAVRHVGEQVNAYFTANSPQRRLRNVVVLGIGGSALGNIALHAALNPPTWNLLPDDVRPGPRLFVLDNVDPTLVGHTMRFLQADDPKLEHTLVNVISKSGETA